MAVFQLDETASEIKEAQREHTRDYSIDKDFLLYSAELLEEGMRSFPEIEHFLAEASLSTVGTGEDLSEKGFMEESIVDEKLIKELIDSNKEELRTIGNKIDNMNTELGRRIDTTNTRIDTINTELGKKIDNVNTHLGERLSSLKIAIIVSLVTLLVGIIGVISTIIWGVLKIVITGII